MKPLKPLVLCLCAATCQMALPRELLDYGWRFCLGDAPHAESVNYDDASWRVLDLPHDWSIEHNTDREAPAGNDGGYYPTGIGWYRKTLNMSRLNKTYSLYVEGAYERSTVFVNGQKVGGHIYGYSGYWVDITQALKVGDNVIAIRVDNSHQKNCRWYSGSGLYRHVWLVDRNRQYIDNVQVTTPDLHTLCVRTTVVNRESKPCRVALASRIAQRADSIQVTLQPGEWRIVAQTMHLPDVEPWSTDSPNLYGLDVTLQSATGKAWTDVDEQHVDVGFRTIDYDAHNGFRLNGKPLKLNGGCVHHDNGILGAAAYDRAEYRRVELLKEAGFNAVRTSHNIPSEAFLDACDRLGLLVIDEAFDGWSEQKNKEDYHQFFFDHFDEDVTAMVKRDRNHPSIFCWSIGNEIIERKSPLAVSEARALRSAVRQWDTTRPVTSALASWDSDWEIYDALAAEHDIVGYNYMIHKAASDHERVPGRVMMQTESYPRDAFANWQGCMEHSYRLGDFVWTAMDYLGESGIGRYWYEGDVPGEHYQRPLYPWHAAYCGDIDLTGWRKPVSHYRAMLWNADSDSEILYLAVREPDGYRGKIATGAWAVWPTWESWTWPGWEGQNIEVEVYSRYPKVQLYLDNRLVEEKSVAESTQYKAVFTLPYQPGRLVAKAGGEERVLSTAGKPAQLRLRADRTQLQGDDLCFVTIEMLDRKGNVCPDDSTLLEVQLKGAARLLAVGNADIKDTDSYVDTVHHLWKGRALAVIRSVPSLTAAATTDEVEVVVKAGKMRKAVKIQVLR